MSIVKHLFAERGNVRRLEEVVVQNQREQDEQLKGCTLFDHHSQNLLEHFTQHLWVEARKKNTQHERSFPTLMKQH